MTDVVSRLWGFAHPLRHDGVDYGDFIEQITYLLFLKMADEQDIKLPANTDWQHLRAQSGVALVESYEDALRTLGKQPGMLGDIFAGSQNRLGNPATLAQLIKSTDETEWTSLKVDVKAAAFEGLLEKAAAEGKKGAGQYFTPRPLIQSMVRLMQPDPRVSKQFAIGDPACGTGGFLVAAYEWLKEQTGGAFDRETARRIRTSTYYGQELVPRPRRLALMNLYLHQVEPHITLGDSIYEMPSTQRFDVILTNPPFGSAIGAASDRLEYGTSRRTESVGEVPVLRMGNIQAGRLDVRELKYLSANSETAALALAEGDILFNRTNSPELVGKSAVFHEPEPMTFASYLIRVRLATEVADPDFANYWLNSSWGRHWAQRVRTDGVSQSNINGSKLAGMPLPLPPLEEQREIVRRADAMLAIADRLGAQIDSTAVKLDRLSSASRMKAFRGEIRPTDAP